MSLVVRINNDGIKIFAFNFCLVPDRQNIFGKFLIILFLEFYADIVAVYHRSAEYFERIFFFRNYLYGCRKICFYITA
ncbi:MAG: hypothetical protein QG578_830 [Thermodesulfobacteriota bacterium]|nr:hypothetical protein [Thermodesulfobacteriota bacterium]